MKPYQVFFWFLLFRILSIFLIKTWYVPDEYWQSLEVGHKLAFGYGHLTWEWTKGIRSYFHPVIIAGVYKLLEFFQLDTVECLIIIPRILQALLTTYSDYRFYKWCNKSKWSIFIITTSWFWFYTGTRTLTNTIETSLTTIALSYFPWKGEQEDFILPVALACLIRPTAVIPWIPLCLYHMYKSKFSAGELLLKRYLLVGFIVSGSLITIDCLAHGELIITPWEFLKVNIIENIGNFYGSNEWHWYFTIGLPTVLGINTIPFIFAIIKIIRTKKETYKYNIDNKNQLVLLITILFTLIVYSLIEHKEFRFILGILPIVLYLIANYLKELSKKLSYISIWLITITILIGNIVPSYYLSIKHQRGNIDVMNYINNDIIGKTDNLQNIKILYLMPCHSTPYYSHVHKNVTMRFLTCEPNLNHEENYIDEADIFYKDPPLWLRRNLPVHPISALPSHLIMFDRLETKISDFLKKYTKIYTIYNTEISLNERIGENILIYERNDPTKVIDEDLGENLFNSNSNKEAINN